MNNEQIVKLNGFYKQLKRIEKQIQPRKGQTFEIFTVNSYNCVVDEIASILGDNNLQYKVPVSELQRNIDAGWSWYNQESIETRLNLVLGMLEGELNIDDEKTESVKGNLVTVINQNTIGVNIQQTINQLIVETKDEELKEKLTELNNELEQPKKDWSKIKNLLIWIINFSEKLFFTILPELLKKYNQ